MAKVTATLGSTVIDWAKIAELTATIAEIAQAQIRGGDD